jgi:hypothetical protein
VTTAKRPSDSTATDMLVGVNDSKDDHIGFVKGRTSSYAEAPRNPPSSSQLAP